MGYDQLRTKIKDFLNVNLFDKEVEFQVYSKQKEEEYTRFLISYEGNKEDKISAYLLVPEGKGSFPGLIINHQHNSEWHLGKSEVCGLAGDPLNAFGSYLANRGIVVLAPDSICFEDRRRKKAVLRLLRMKIGCSIIMRCVIG